ncbi:ribosome silencing factor [bacterium]|jgi:ribosome-associated protein|nr:ribosome silencing factor [bacterium]
MSKLKQYIDQIVVALEDKKALDIRFFEVSERSSVTDFVMVVGASNNIHVRALQNAVDEVSHELGADEDLYDHLRISGKAESGWVVLDLNSIIIHVILEDLRQFYELDAHFEKKVVASPTH